VLLAVTGYSVYYGRLWQDAARQKQEAAAQ
jgi:hypothetical protein